MAKIYPAIQEPSIEPEALRATQIQMKEGLEILMRQRGNKAYSAVTWADLVALGLIPASKIPK